MNLKLSQETIFTLLLKLLSEPIFFHMDHKLFYFKVSSKMIQLKQEDIMEWYWLILRQMFRHNPFSSHSINTITNSCLWLLIMISLGWGKNPPFQILLNYLLEFHQSLKLWLWEDSGKSINKKDQKIKLECVAMVPMIWWQLKRLMLEWVLVTQTLLSLLTSLLLSSRVSS